MNDGILELPNHVAIIMDGNGRWAKRRFLPRITGHQQGVDSVRTIVRCCKQKQIEVLTLFAFSSENWQRPQEEVQALMGLILKLLKKELSELHKNNVRLRIVGDRTALNLKLQDAIEVAENTTRNNKGLQLNIALNYGGRWDIVQAVRQIVKEVQQKNLAIEDVTELLFAKYLSLSDLPYPDLFIRTSQEYRVSNFLLWQLAYTEMYFSDVHWPDFDENEFEKALTFYQTRQRRFGKISEQVTC